ncbi:MAG TPA: hypothetical protein VIT43_01555 [Candidatus Dormibacteraeota bacterium]
MDAKELAVEELLDHPREARQWVGFEEMGIESGGAALLGRGHSRRECHKAGVLEAGRPGDSAKLEAAAMRHVNVRDYHCGMILLDHFPPPVTIGSFQYLVTIDFELGPEHGANVRVIIDDQDLMPPRRCQTGVDLAHLPRLTRYLVRHPMARRSSTPQMRQAIDVFALLAG